MNSVKGGYLFMKGSVYVALSMSDFLVTYEARAAVV